jgi:uncharacterized Tic20 family protein
MDKNIDADNIVVLNTNIVKNSTVTISHVVNFVVVAVTLLLAKSFPSISKIELEGSKKGFFVSLTCMKLLMFLSILKLVIMPNHGHMRARFVDTSF